MKRGLKEFQLMYDLVIEGGWLALDLAQNLSFKLEYAKPEYAKITTEDVHMAYGLTGSGKQYPIDTMKAVHSLATALGFTREDYIENADKRCGKGNCNIHVIGEDKSINCDIGDVLQ